MFKKIMKGCVQCKKVFIKEEKVGFKAIKSPLTTEFDDHVIIESTYRCNKCGTEFKKRRLEPQW